jgi:stage V sporulation protein AC
MKISKTEYKKMADEAIPPSRKQKNMICAFLIGGLICSIGQILYEIYQRFGLNQDDTSTAVSISLIFLGAFLTGINLYHSIAKVAGAGTLVPITGFSNAVVSPAMEFKREGQVLGIGAKMFTIAGPVIVFGTIAASLY